jgi:glycosyltransferase involved in cell wall biosynthesis
LNITITLAARIAAKLTGTQAIGIVTDLQKNMGAARKDNRHTKIIPQLITKFSGLFITSFDKYVMLTGAMDVMVNPKKKPFIIMEGLVDVNMKSRSHQSFDVKQKDIIYAGGIYEKYGVRILIDAFYNIKQANINLHIYGLGEMEQDMPFLMKRDSRLKYHGMVPNEVVVNHQLSATLMINPRPTSNGFTKYSFPSKNLEYMVSGTPLLTTPLEGMPDEYKQYVYLINDERVEGIERCITEIINKPARELEIKGNEAKQFVLENKNNVVQSLRMISLAKK